jgi:hypothetical protein
VDTTMAHSGYAKTRERESRSAAAPPL